MERNNLKFKVLYYILYGNEKSIHKIFNTSIQLVRTYLVLNWDQDEGEKKVLLSKNPIFEFFEITKAYGETHLGN